MPPALIVECHMLLIFVTVFDGMLTYWSDVALFLADEFVKSQLKNLSAAFVLV